jgi:hypothetical protein
MCGHNGPGLLSDTNTMVHGWPAAAVLGMSRIMNITVLR